MSSSKLQVLCRRITIFYFPYYFLNIPYCILNSYPEWSPLLLKTKFCGPTIIQILIIEWSDFKGKNRHSKCWDKLFETPIPKFWFSMFLFERHKSAEQFLFLCYCTRTVLSVRHQISHPLRHQSSPPPLLCLASKSLANIAEKCMTCDKNT